MTDSWFDRASFAPYWGPLIYLALGVGLLWCASSSEFIREDAIDFTSYSGRLKTASIRGLVLSREIGEDAAYYRPIHNLILAGLSRTFGTSDARPMRLFAGLFWLICAAFCVIPFRRAGIQRNWAWLAAACVMVHPYNSWYFGSVEISANSLVIPLTIGLWLSFCKLDERPCLGILGIVAFTYANCLIHETGILAVGGVWLAAFGFGTMKKRVSLGLISVVLAVGLYWMQRRWVLEHDPASFSLSLDFARLANSPTVLWQTAKAILGSFRVAGGSIPFAGPVHWAVLGLFLAGVLYLSRGRLVTIVWTLLVLISSAESVLAGAVTGDMMPVRATIAVALCTGLAFWWAVSRPNRRRWQMVCMTLVGVFWYANSARHLYASRNDVSFLEIHSNPPYSWKIEAERAAAFLRQKDISKALYAARMSEQLRPVWLTKVLRASVEYVVEGRPETLAELDVLTNSGTNEPGAEIGYVNLGVAFARKRLWERAETCFRKAQNLAPESSNVLSQWAWMETTRGNWLTGEEVALKTIQLNPNDLNSWQNLGYCRLFLHNWLGAEEAYSRLLQLGPNRPGVLLHYVFALEQQERFQDAWQTLSLSTWEQDPLLVAYRFILGQRLGVKTDIAVSPAALSNLQTHFQNILSPSKKTPSQKTVPGRSPK